MTPLLDEPASSPLSLFYCYARKDQALRDEIDVHLAVLRRSRLFTSWHDAMIVPGTDWEHEIVTRLNAASIILLLVSPDFLNSDYCYGREMQRAIERHTKGEAHIIPILLRPAYWKGTPFSALQMLPTNAIPVTLWSNRDAALEDIARGIHRVVNGLIKQRMQAKSLIKQGRALNEKHRHQEALPLFQRATKLAPGFSAAWFQLGFTLNALKRYQEALDACDHALTLNPAYTRAWSNKSDILYILKRYQEALDACDRALVLNPVYASAWINKGNALTALQRYQEALDAYDRALDIDPTGADAWSRKSFVLQHLGRSEEA